MPDQPMAEDRPLVARNELHQVALDLLWRTFARESETMRQPLHVSVYHDALFDPVGIT